MLIFPDEVTHPQKWGPFPQVSAVGWLKENFHSAVLPLGIHNWGLVLPSLVFLSFIWAPGIPYPPDLHHGPTCSSSPNSATHQLELVSEQDPNTSSDPSGFWSHALRDPSVPLLLKVLCDKVKLFPRVRNACVTSSGGDSVAQSCPTLS